MVCAHRIIIDTDPGVDDLLAILLALNAPRDTVEVMGITTVAGNVGVDQTTSNACDILAMLGRSDIPVYQGCSRPVMAAIGARAPVHGLKGLGTVELMASTVSPRTAHAVDYLIDSILAHPGEITLCLMAPMTNIALALIKAPEIAAKIKQIILMGGAAFVPGNITPAAEFNVFVDPHAAHIVFESGIPITMFGLDVTRAITMPRDSLTAPWSKATSAGRSIAQMVADYTSEDPALHDLCVVAWLHKPEMFSGVDAFVEVDSRLGSNFGRLTVSTTARHLSGRAPNAHVITQGDAPAIFELLQDALNNLSTR